MNTREVVNEFLRRRATGDVDRIMELVGDPADFRSYGSPLAPWLGRKSRRDEIRLFFESLFSETIAHGADLDAVIIDGDEAVVVGELSAKVTATGRVYRSPFVLRLTVHDGLIVRHHVYEDSYALHEAIKPATTPPHG